jgi:hypothetical protein
LELKKIHIIGSSIASRFGIEEKSWPELFADQLASKALVTHEIQYGLNFSRSIPFIANVEPVDMLVLHYGIAVGWPVSYRKVDIKLGTTPLKNEYAYHQPIGKGRSPSRRIKNRIKFRVRNAVKYLLFLTGQYKPRVNQGDLEDQVAAVLSVAQNRAKEVVWIQHVPAWSMRTLVERWYYKNYVSRIERFALKHAQAGVTFVIPDEPLTDAKNYALDTTHLSSAGHIAYAQMMRQLPVIERVLAS